MDILEKLLALGPSGAAAVFGIVCLYLILRHHRHQEEKHGEAISDMADAIKEVASGIEDTGGKVSDSINQMRLEVKSVEAYWKVIHDILKTDGGK
jgi:hypothetical protein